MIEVLFGTHESLAEDGDVHVGMFLFEVPLNEAYFIIA